MSSLNKHTVIADDVTLSYVDIGSGPALLFLHGLSFVSNTYANTLLTLSKRFRVIAPDLHFAYKNESISDLDLYVKIIDILVEHLSLDKFIVIGHSFGGAVGLRYSFRYPQKVKELFLLDSVGVVLNCPEWKIYSLLIIEAIKELMLHENLPKYVMMVSRVLFSMFRAIPQYWSTRNGVVQLLNQEAIAFKELKIPVHIVWGKDDILVPSSAGKKLQSLIAKSHYEEIPGSHNWPMFAPERVFKIITST